jgi:hypothetical protein
MAKNQPFPIKGKKKKREGQRKIHIFISLEFLLELTKELVNKVRTAATTKVRMRCTG